MSDGQRTTGEDEPDYYFDPDTGLLVLTSTYLRRRRECCGNKCRHCPYGWQNVPPSNVAPGEQPVESDVQP